MPKVILKGFIRVSSGDLEIIKSHLDEHIRLTRSELGCLTFSVSQRNADPSIFDVYEEFEDATSYTAHQTRTKLSRWSKATKNVERHYEVSGLVLPSQG
jgi:autoinducer 2-degrading protein